VINRCERIRHRYSQKGQKSVEELRTAIMSIAKMRTAFSSGVIIIGYLHDTITMESAGAKCELPFEELQKIVAPIAEKHGMIRVYLFGSRARGDNAAESDFDFCIVAPKEYGLMKLGSFLCDLRDALRAEVDIVCEESIEEKSYFMEEMLRDRKIVFEA